MTARRTLTKYKGVFQRESTERVFSGKSDVCFDIAYKTDGKLIWEKVGWLSEGYSAKLADQVRSERIRTIRHSGELPKQKTKAPFLKDVWIEFYKWAQGNKVRNAIDDLYRYEKHIKPDLADKRLNEIRPLDLERLKKKMADSGLAPATQKHVLTVIREIYNKSAENKLYQGSNPTKDIIKKINVNNERQRFLSFEEAKRILEYFKDKNSDVYDICLMSFFCGLRFGEVAGIKCEHVDMKNSSIAIMDPKNRENRHTRMNNIVLEVVSRRMTNKPEAYLFPDKYGKRRRRMPNAYFKGIREMGFNAGIEDRRHRVYFHTARHSYGSWLVTGGETLYMTGVMLGHKSPEMTKRYAHLSPEHKSEVSQQLADRFKDASQNGNVVSIDRND